MSKFTRRSPDRYTFHTSRLANEVDRRTDELLNILEQLRRQDLDNVNNPEWQKDNLEYDLRSTDWIVNKVKENDNYAQNLYAAMCNREFTKNELWPLLTEKRWSCSWRHAGGIIADMREQGDYIDWYCSGIRNDGYQDDLESVEPNQYVSEGVVTDEIREDLLKLGWVVLDD